MFFFFTTPDSVSISLQRFENPKNDGYYLREYTYVPQGSGIVHIAITGDACKSVMEEYREGPTCHLGRRAGAPGCYRLM